MILNSFVHITNTERNITRKDQARCYEKYTVHRRNGNNGFATFTTATVINILPDVSKAT